MVNMPNIVEARQDALGLIFEIRKSNGLWGDFQKYSRLYHIATEDIPSYTNQMDSNFTTTLTIGGSGDQGIASVIKGAKDVYFFDINKVDMYFLSLKKVAMENLRRKDFLDFLIAEHTGIIMNYRLYQKIQERIPLPIRVFWDIIYEYFEYDNEIISEELFRSPKKHASFAGTVNHYYCNNQIYYDTQEKVKQSRWHFIEGDFYSLGKNIPDGITFDSMILSNIYEYLNFGINMNPENAMKYVQFIKNVLLPKLNPSGNMIVSYLCRYNEEVHHFISQKLITEPNGWLSSEPTLQEFIDKGERFLEGYTGQNVSYYHLLESLRTVMPFQLVKTKWAGYGMSNAKEDTAILVKKK